MKGSLLTLILVGFSIFSSAQEAFKIKELKNNTNWIQDVNLKSNVTVNHKIETCYDEVAQVKKNMLLLRFANLNQNDINISYDLALVYGENCFNCNGERGDEFSYKVDVQAKGTKEGTCNMVKSTGLVIFSSFEDIEASELSEVRFMNVKVAPK